MLTTGVELARRSDGGKPRNKRNREREQKESKINRKEKEREHERNNKLESG